MRQCPFCSIGARALLGTELARGEPAASLRAIPDDRVVWHSDDGLVFAIRDRYPVSRGHTLVLPRRHVETYFDVTEKEREAVWAAVESVKQALDAEFRPAGYNVGFNAGVAAGQTVMHLHVHVIPRFAGDVDEPAGGVRFVIPAHGNYKDPGRLPVPTGLTPSWLTRSDSHERLVTGGYEDPFGRHLREALHRARQADIVAAFVQGSGVEHLDSAITAALERGTRFRVVTGDYLHITQSQALRRLLDWSQIAASLDLEALSLEVPAPGTFDVRIVETRAIGGRSFHPKSWRIETDTEGIAWVGSSNWSWMALNDGIEWNLRVERASDPRAYRAVVGAFEGLWGTATPLTATWLKGLGATT